MSEKPLGIKNYGSIPHLPGSRRGPGDHGCNSGQARICCEKVRDKHDRVWVTEKIDGSNVGIAKLDGKLLALGRAGYLAQSSPFEQHQLFAFWVRENYAQLDAYIHEGERVIGEWIAQAHGTRYAVSKSPLFVFDIMVGSRRLPFASTVERCRDLGIPSAWLLNDGHPMSIPAAMKAVEPSHCGALDPVEGCVWRVERKGEFDFMAKYVRPEKQDGIYLPEISGKPEVWNWRP